MGIKSLEELRELADKQEDSNEEITESINETAEEETREKAPVEQNDERELDNNAEREDERSIEESESVESTEYTPNLKFKSFDTEFEFEEGLKELVKDPQTEQKLRDLHERAYGMKYHKEKNQELSSKVKEAEQYRQAIEYYDSLLEKKDYDNFFKVSEIPEDEILKHAAKILDLKELTPEQRAEYNRSVEEKNRLYQLQMENEYYRNNNYQAQLQQSKQMLEVELQLANDVVNDFDSRVGKQGAFMQEVINRAAWVEQQTNGQRILSPKEAVDYTIQQLGLRGTPTTNPPQTNSGSNANIHNNYGTNTPTQRRDRPTMPNIEAGGKSPAKKVFRSIDDLRKYADQMDY